MSERSFAASELINLPVMDAHRAVAVGTEILRAGKGAGDLPALVQKALGAVEATHKTLSEAVAAWPGPGVGDPAAARKADRAMDAAWAAFHAYLKAWTRLPVELAEEGSKAQELLTDLFSEGLRFTQAAFRMEWSESAARLKRMSDRGHDAFVEQMGGQKFLDALRRAHEAYGDALGVTAERPEAEAAPAIREPLDAFRAALRTYALRVAATVDEDAPATGKLAQRLLAPLAA